jgi:hypothetical protein
MGRWTLDTAPAYITMDLMSRVLSPYDLNPLDFNPLRDLLAESINFDRLVSSPIMLYKRTDRHGRMFRSARSRSITMLRTEGRRAASKFLDSHADDLGNRSVAELDVLLAEC